MTKLLLLTLLFSIYSLVSKAQETASVKKADTILAPANNSPTIKDHAYYLEKSRKQRTTGLAMLGAGVFFSGAGLLIGASSNASFDDAETGAIIMGIGALSGIISIPFMASSLGNHIKANVLVKNQKTGYGIPFKSKQVTGLTVGIKLGR